MSFYACVCQVIPKQDGGDEKKDLNWFDDNSEVRG